MKEKKISYVFFGTPQFATSILKILKEKFKSPSLIVTAPDKPVGRKQILTAPKVKEWAIHEKIPFIQVEHPKDGYSILKKRKDDLFIVASYGYIIPQEILDIPKYGTLNVHASLLPKYRGASPIESAILNGDTKTGVTIMKMIFRMDAGPILSQREIPLQGNEKKSELFSILAKQGGELLVETIPPYLDGKIEEKEQKEEQATYCKKIKKEDGDISNDNDEIRWRKYRAYEGWPGIFFFEDGKRIKVTHARYEQGKFIIEKIIPEGKKEMEYQIFIRNKNGK